MEGNFASKTRRLKIDWYMKREHESAKDCGRSGHTMALYLPGEGVGVLYASGPEGLCVVAQAIGMSRIRIDRIDPSLYRLHLENAYLRILAG